jgi:glucosamine--fructose-6-phosphate aminotransferase (isomerizing)
MREQILSQPEALRSLLARRGELADLLAAIAPAVHRIWAVGHGDSYFAPLAAAAAFRRCCSSPYVPCLAQELTAYAPRGVDDSALVIVLSMSGGVGRSIAAAETARDRGARVLAITNTAGSPITGVAHAVVLLNIAEPAPFLAGTVTYTASVLMLMMVASLLGQGRDEAALAAAVDAVDAALASEVSIREWILPLAVSPVWYFLGMDCHVATAHYGAAKLVEVADAVGIAHETEEFFHEHHWVIRRDNPVVLLSHDGPSQKRSESAIAHLRELGIPVWLVGSGPAPAGVRHVSVNPVEAWCAALPGAVPVQWLAYWLARAKRVDPDRRTHLRDSPRYSVSRKYR